MYTMTSLLGNTQKLDGGAMFGNAPKALWSRWITPDDHNRIALACRCLLIQEPERNVLLETGIGAFFNPTLRERYGVEEASHVLLASLQQVGLSDTDIDIVILSHLHFDHAGGLLSPWDSQSPPRLLFPNAKYVVSRDAWERARQPHIRDKASFIPELNQLLIDSNRLVIVDSEHCDLLGNAYEFKFTHGHTPGLMHTIVTAPQRHRPVIFSSDLIPGTSWVHLPMTMGYDRAPECLIDEKKKLLDLCIQRNGQLFYTHDPVIAMSSVKCDAMGKYTIDHPMHDFQKSQ